MQREYLSTIAWSYRAIKRWNRLRHVLIVVALLILITVTLYINSVISVSNSCTTDTPVLRLTAKETELAAPYLTMEFINSAPQPDPNNTRLPSPPILGKPDWNQNSRLHSPPILSHPEWNQNYMSRRLPGVLIIGAMKAGTGSLRDFLCLHPDVVGRRREVKFFDKDEVYEKGVEFYRQQMPFTLPGQITIEKTPYFHAWAAAGRMRKFNKDLKLILIVRDPVERMISEYAMYLARDGTTMSKQEFMADALTVCTLHWSYVSRMIKKSLYAVNLSYWLQYFPVQQFHIVHGDAFMRHPYGELIAIEEFLRVPKYFTKEMFYTNATTGFGCFRDEFGQERCMPANKGRQHPEFSDKFIQQLRNCFQGYNHAFYKLIGRNFHWKDSLSQLIANSSNDVIDIHNDVTNSTSDVINLKYDVNNSTNDVKTVPNDANMFNVNLTKFPNDKLSAPYGEAHGSLYSSNDGTISHDNVDMQSPNDVKNNSQNESLDVINHPDDVKQSSPSDDAKSHDFMKVANSSDAAVNTK